MTHSRPRGFTLVELLAVVASIVMLAMLMPALQAQEKADETTEEPPASVRALLWYIYADSPAGWIC